MQDPDKLVRYLGLIVLGAVALGGCTTTRTRVDWVRVPRQNAVQAPPPAYTPPPPAYPPSVPATDDDFTRWAGDRVFFDTDRATLSLNARDILARQAEWLGRHPNVAVRIEGNTDERGSAQHNMGLGQRRADAVRDYLVRRGVAGARISTMSNGVSRPIETGSDEASHARNRNAQTVVITVQGL
jgi:peptidoglycan-associated lipoprotein